MRFRSGSSHSETLADGREVGPYGEFELTPAQYNDPEQWLLLGRPGYALGLTKDAEKLVQDALDDPHNPPDPEKGWRFEADEPEPEPKPVPGATTNGGTS